jgi:uncharacterized caspase-like protein
VRFVSAILAVVVANIVTVAAWSPSAMAQKRVALVIGNSAYVNTPRLENPKNDAADFASTLKQLGFGVTEGRDLDKAAMDRAIRTFAETLSGAQMGLFFYAGHGLQVGGQNYLVPVDAKLTSATALDFEMVRLDLIQRSMERGATSNILILDACRDNPLARNLARALGSRSATIGRGLAAMESGEGTLISYSTQPGNVALDGTGRNSPFAAAMIRHVKTPGDDLAAILINVRNDVMAATDRRQVPWEHSALTAKVYFIPPKPSASAHDQQVELTFWASVKDSTSPTVLRTYLERYPSGEFATIARALIEHYEQQARAALAAREEEERRLEQEKKAAELQRLEEQKRAREAALAQERIRAKQAKDAAEVKRVEEQERAEHLARQEQVKKAQQDAQRAKEAAKAAEKQRLASEKAAKEAAAAAEKAIERKQQATTGKDNTQVVAALPKIEKPAASQFDGTWTVSWLGVTGCFNKSGSYEMKIEGGKIVSHKWSGTMGPTGSMRWTGSNSWGPIHYSGKFSGREGTGSFRNNNCSGTFSATRN